VQEAEEEKRHSSSREEREAAVHQPCTSTIIDLQTLPISFFRYLLCRAVTRTPFPISDADFSRFYAAEFFSVFEADYFFIAYAIIFAFHLFSSPLLFSGYYAAAYHAGARVRRMFVRCACAALCAGARSARICYAISALISLPLRHYAIISLPDDD